MPLYLENILYIVLLLLIINCVWRLTLFMKIFEISFYEMLLSWWRFKYKYGGPMFFPFRIAAGETDARYEKSRKKLNRLVDLYWIVVAAMLLIIVVSAIKNNVRK